ncbi:MAG: ABC transporter ATP-binding protein [Rhodospirillales bacterium]|nr:ABC transporter ATP-binding protein [Rhodospirillales bacterium]
MIALENATIVRAGQRALDRVSFAVRPGELCAIVGPNGAGKSTLLLALAGLLPGTPRRDPRQVAWLEQGARAAWGMTVAEVAGLGRLPHGGRDPGAVARALQALGIAPLALARIDQLSGGQARRAMLARVLATEATVLLLDEPTADLDPAAAEALMTLLRRQAAAGKAVVVVLHAVELAMRHASRVAVMQRGTIVADGPPGAVLEAAAATFGMRVGSDPSPRLLP